VRGWRGLSAFGEPGSNVVLPEEPAIFQVDGLHAKVAEANALGYFSRSRDRLGLAAADVEAIREAGLPEIYEGWRTTCAEDLGLYVSPDQEFI